ncbi:DNA mismatch repair endonuclease MutL [Mycoplasmatota bacterium WC44]
MNRIVKLDEKISNMIAAGEVVERPLSVVKELVENSVDAGATYIDIELEESGVSLIRITDNGIGMTKDDALLAFSRHATSKIKNEHDLFRINTLGFRGEALPSIASVSKVKMVTSTGGDGYSVEINGGNMISHGLSTSRKGTEISVRDLFYNTPARLKYLKSLSSELSVVSDFITKLALTYPNISFKLTNNGNGLINTDGGNDHLKVISSVYGLQVAKSMKTIKCSNYDYSVNGYISNPTVNRSSKNYINIIVNNRVVKHFILSNAIIEAYGNKLPSNRYPIALINIECDPLLVDVNVHPSKMQIKLTDERKLTSIIRDTIKEILNETVSIPEITSNVPNEVKIITEANVTGTNVTGTNVTGTNVTETSVSEQLSFDYKSDSISESTPEYNVSIFPTLEYIGQFHGTYLVCQSREGLYIIDQHAAAERINYEKYLRKLSKKSNESYELLTPINIEYSNSESIKINEIIDELKGYGITLETSGINSFYLREVPLWFKPGLELEYTKEVIATLVDDRKNLIVDHLAATLACKRSIKANDYINDIEVQTLINDLTKCDNPYTCPHGRPTIIKYSIREIERFFRR